MIDADTLIRLYLDNIVVALTSCELCQRHQPPCVMKVSFGAFLFFCQISLLLHARKKSVPKLLWKRYKPCDDFKNVKADVVKLEFAGDLKTESYFNAELEVGDYEIPEHILVTASVSKCVMIGDNNCEHFIKADSDFCELVRKRKGQFYSRALNFEPPVCPIRANTKYTIRNGTLDSNAMLLLTGGMPDEYQNYYWNFNLVLKDGDKQPHETLMCINVMYKIYMVKV